MKRCKPYPRPPTPAADSRSHAPIPSAHRFWVTAETLGEEVVRFDGRLALQVRRVLRLRAGEEIALFCGDGWEHHVTLTEVGEARVEGRVVERRQPETEPRARVWLAVALLKGEKLEWVVQKGTELGAAGFLLLETERAVVQAGPERWSARRERYDRIAREAAEQCGRVRVPAIEGPLPFPGALARVDAFDHVLVAHERSPVPLKDALTPRSEPGARPGEAGALLFVGPEGGFTADEVAAAAAAGATAVSLGTRVLRAETAALALATRVLAALEE